MKFLITILIILLAQPLVTFANDKELRWTEGQLSLFTKLGILNPPYGLDEKESFFQISGSQSKAGFGAFIMNKANGSVRFCLYKKGNPSPLCTPFSEVDHKKALKKNRYQMISSVSVNSKSPFGVYIMDLHGWVKYCYDIKGWENAPICTLKN